MLPYPKQSGVRCQICPFIIQIDLISKFLLNQSNFSIHRAVGHPTDVLSFQNVDIAIHTPGLAPGVLHKPLGPLLSSGVLPTINIVR
jgi:hypothetical protein